MIRAPFQEAKTFGERLHEARMRARGAGGRRITQEQLAEAIGVERNTVSRWENGSMLPKDPATIATISRVLNVSADWLLGDLADANATANGTSVVNETPRHTYGPGMAESLPRGVADLVFRYIERMAAAGCSKEQQREGERLLVQSAQNGLRRVPVSQRTVEEVQADVDDAWDFVTRVLRRDGIRP